MTIETLARPEIRSLLPYSAAMQATGAVRLNANEAPWPRPDQRGSALNRYPELRPRVLQEQLARHYDVLPERLLVTRGSSEAIDLLLRAFCRPGVDNVVVTPPTFSMYRVYAEIQGAAVRSVPLLAANDYELDVDALLESCDARTKLIFICSPNNPTGNLVPATALLTLALARSSQSLVVVDEAYIEFSGTTSLATRSSLPDNLVVLRTLSKALALAGARCGAVLGCDRLVGLLGGILAPYALATPVIDCVLEALDPRDGNQEQEACARIVEERDRLARELPGIRRVVKVWPSRANFLLVQFQDLAAIQDRLRANGVLIRDFPDDRALADCARVTVGSRADNDQLLALLSRC